MNSERMLRAGFVGVALVLAAGPLMWAQNVGAVSAPGSQIHGPVPLRHAECCGPVTAEGRQLRQVLDGMDVEHLWLNHEHVDWETGKPDRGPSYDGPDTHSHCSAFAAAVGLRLGIYMLRPPDHPQQLLASAQGEWFATAEARAQSWKDVDSAREAQKLANRGELVVLVYVSQDLHRPGHIAIVRPAIKTDDALAADGPETIQAGVTNFVEGTARQSFQMHEGAWPDRVRIYAHATSFGTEAASSEKDK